MSDSSEDTPANSAANSRQIDEALAAEIKQLAAQGLTINAVKRYRAATGVSLSEAKSAVESLCEHGTTAPPNRELPADRRAVYEKAVLDLLRNKQTIEAIRLYRDQHGTDLKSSKEAIEELARRHGIEAKVGGCGSVVALLAVLLVVGIGVAATIVYGL